MRYHGDVHCFATPGRLDRRHSDPDDSAIIKLHRGDILDCHGNTRVGAHVGSEHRGRNYRVKGGYIHVELGNNVFSDRTDCRNFRA